MVKKNRQISLDLAKKLKIAGFNVPVSDVYLSVWDRRNEVLNITLVYNILALISSAGGNLTNILGIPYIDLGVISDGTIYSVIYEYIKKNEIPEINWEYPPAENEEHIFHNFTCQDMIGRSDYDWNHIDIKEIIFDYLNIESIPSRVDSFLLNLIVSPDLFTNELERSIAVSQIKETTLSTTSLIVIQEYLSDFCIDEKEVIFNHDVGSGLIKIGNRWVDPDGFSVQDVPGFISAPSYDDVFEWLGIKKGLHININWNTDKEKWSGSISEFPGIEIISENREDCCKNLIETSIDCIIAYDL